MAFCGHHVGALIAVLERGKAGETYNIGGNCELTNMAVAEASCELFDGKLPQRAPHSKLISFAKDRPGTIGATQ